MDGEINMDEGCGVVGRGGESQTSAMMNKKGEGAGLVTGEGKIRHAFHFNLD